MTSRRLLDRDTYGTYPIPSGVKGNPVRGERPFPTMPRVVLSVAGREMRGLTFARSAQKARFAHWVPPFRRSVAGLGVRAAWLAVRGRVPELACSLADGGQVLFPFSSDGAVTPDLLAALQALGHHAIQHCERNWQRDETGWRVLSAPCVGCRALADALGIGLEPEGTPSASTAPPAVEA